jgi:hypothetical protein
MVMAAAVSKAMVSGSLISARRDQPLGAVGAQRVQEAGVRHAIAGHDVGHALAHLHHAGGFHAHAAGSGTG